MRNLAFNYLRFYVLSPANGAFTLVPLPQRLKPRPPSNRPGPDRRAVNTDSGAGGRRRMRKIPVHSVMPVNRDFPVAEDRGFEPLRDVTPARVPGV